jgi:SM-20-related protein
MRTLRNLKPVTPADKAFLDAGFRDRQGSPKGVYPGHSPTRPNRPGGCCLNASSSDPLLAVVEALEARGWVCLDGFLAPDEARELAAECLEAREAGEFRRARVGRGSDLVIREDIRRDEVLWLADKTSGPAARRYLGRLEELRLAINRRLFLGLFDFEGHFAVYPPGAFYKAHLDRHRGTADRVVTAILYLNDGWKAEDAGRLKIWTEPGRQEGRFEWVEPRLGTLVVFLAGDHWHEVEEANKTRASVTGWFRVRG